MVLGDRCKANRGDQFNTSYIDPNSALIECNNNVTNYMCCLYDKNLGDEHRIKDGIPCYEYHVDFIHCLEYLPQYQVVYVHDPDHYNDGFYYCHHIEHGVLHLIECGHNNFGPILVGCSEKFFTRFQFGLHKLENDYAIAKLAYEDYKKDLETRTRFNLNYTEYLELVVDELMDKCNAELDNTYDRDIQQNCRFLYHR